MENFIDSYKKTSSSTFHSCKRHAEFHYFLSDISKQYAATIDAHIKSIIELLKRKQLLFSGMITIWENTYGCADHYRCATWLYLLWIFSQYFNIIIEHGNSATGHGREVVYGLNSKYKFFIFNLITTVKIFEIQRFVTKMAMHTLTYTADVSLAQELQKHLFNASLKMVLLIMVNTKKSR